MIRHAILISVLILTSSCKPTISNEQQQATAEKSSASPLSSILAKPSYDGPFGVAAGEPKSGFSGPIELRPGYYQLPKVPQPYPDVETYIVQNTPAHGTCMVKAIGENIPSDSFGSNVRTAVDKVRDDIKTRYGEPSNEFDFLKSGSIWNDPQDWMMGVFKDERVYAYFWVAPKNADQRVWRNVASIGLSAGSDGHNGWFVLQYDFVGSARCDEDIKKNAARSL